MQSSVFFNTKPLPNYAKYVYFKCSLQTVFNQPHPRTLISRRCIMKNHCFKLAIIVSLLLISLGCDKIQGLNFSPYEGTQNPNNRDYIPAEQIARKLDQTGKHATWIRTFGTTDGLEVIPAHARSLNLSTAIGAWLDYDYGTNYDQMQNLIASAQAGDVDIAIIGNEVLLRNDLTPAELINYINQFKAAIPDVPVATAEVYGELHDHPEVIAACDLVIANFYPFWEGIPVEYGIWKLNFDYQELVAICGGRPVYIGETGWPTAGDPIDQAVPNLENAVFYLKNFLSWAETNNVHYFYFESMDEAWKIIEGAHGKHWGIMSEDGTMKPGMLEALTARISDNWSSSVPGGPGDPEIYSTYMPPIGSFDNLEGQIWHVDTGTNYVVVYIRVNGQWWIKPYYDTPLTPIRPDGSWVTDITTGIYDYLADQVGYFLIPDSYSPPIIGGSSTLPDGLFNNSLAWAIEDR